MGTVMFSFHSLSLVIVLVLVLLLVFSVVSWTILVVKLVQLSRTRRANQAFLAHLEEGTVSVTEEGSGNCPLAALYQAGQKESDQGLESATRALRKTSTQEIDLLERGVGFLATTASTAPFIGLFGTVWGIMNAFQKIGEAGSSSLDIVAPGISEALVTTAIGLAVAIPAGMGYNFLQSRVRKLTNEIDNFTYDYLNNLHRASQARS